MKKTTIIVSAALMLAAAFSSCKKEEQSIEKPILNLNNNNEKLSALYPGFESLHYDLQLAPEDVIDGKISLKITTDADPTGFEIEATTVAADYVDGKIRYQYVRATGVLYAGNHTNADAKRIKVNEAGDEIVIVAGNNIITKSFPVICSETLKYTYWNSSSSATIFLYGYSYDGTASKQIELWSTRDNQHVNIDGKWNDPTQYQGLPSFNNYNFEVNFINGFSHPADTVIGIYPEGDTVYIKYNNKTYWQLYNSSSNGLMKEL